MKGNYTKFYLLAFLLILRMCTKNYNFDQNVSERHPTVCLYTGTNHQLLVHSNLSFLLFFVIIVMKKTFLNSLIFVTNLFVPFNFSFACSSQDAMHCLSMPSVDTLSSVTTPSVSEGIFWLNDHWSQPYGKAYICRVWHHSVRFVYENGKIETNAVHTTPLQLLEQYTQSDYRKNLGLLTDVQFYIDGSWYSVKAYQNFPDQYKHGRFYYSPQ